MEATQAHFTQCCGCEFLGEQEIVCTRHICDWCESCAEKLYSFPCDADEEPFDLCPDCLIELQGVLMGNKLSVLEQGPRPEVEPPPEAGGRKAIPKGDRKFIYERDSHCCVFCGSSDNLEIDHIHPVSKGGKNERGNYQTLCKPCNRVKRDKLNFVYHGMAPEE